MRHLLSPQKAAEQLQVPRSWVYQNKDEIGFFRIGRYVRFDEKDIDKYLERMRHSAA